MDNGSVDHTKPEEAIFYQGKSAHKTPEQDISCNVPDQTSNANETPDQNEFAHRKHRRRSICLSSFWKETQSCFKIKLKPKKCSKPDKIEESRPKSIKYPLNHPVEETIKTDARLSSPSTQRRGSNTPPRDGKYQKLLKRRMTEIPSQSIEQFLQRNKNDPSHPHTPMKKCLDEDYYLESLRHRLQDRRQSTPAVLRQGSTLSESLNRLALGKNKRLCGDYEKGTLSIVVLAIPQTNPRF